MSQAAPQDSARGSDSVKRVDVADQGGQRALVEAHLGVGEVAVVEQHQVGLLLADQLGHVGLVARHVDLDARAAHERAVDEVVEADGEPVPAQRREVRVRGLLDRRTT